MAARKIRCAKCGRRTWSRRWYAQGSGLVCSQECADTALAERVEKELARVPPFSLDYIAAVEQFFVEQREKMERG